MQVKLTKTFNHIVCEQKETEKASQQEIEDKLKSYEFECDFAGSGCKERFKTERGMKIHLHSCAFRYYLESLTKDPVEKVVEAFGKVERRLFKVRWAGCPPDEDTWEPEDNLLADGCKETIDEF